VKRERLENEAVLTCVLLLCIHKPVYEQVLIKKEEKRKPSLRLNKQTNKGKNILQPIPVTVRSAAPRFPKSRFRVPLRHVYKFLVFFVCCVGSGVCDELITRSEEAYRVRACVRVCDLETSTTRQSGP
jgi:hypothetical protein